MKHTSSRDLYAYWDRRRGTRLAPERADIEPGAIRHVLSDAFILAIDSGAGHPFRLAGTRLCALFGRELKSRPFVGLWTAASQHAVMGLLDVLANENVGTVAAVTTHNDDGETVDLELLLLPLMASRRSLVRALGILAPLQVPAWIGSKPLGALTIGGRRHLGAEVESRFLPRFMAARRRALVVYEGGRNREHPAAAG